METKNHHHPPARARHGSISLPSNSSVPDIKSLTTHIHSALATSLLLPPSGPQQINWLLSAQHFHTPLHEIRRKVLRKCTMRYILNLSGFISANSWHKDTGNWATLRVATRSRCTWREESLCDFQLLMLGLVTEFRFFCFKAKFRFLFGELFRECDITGQNEGHWQMRSCSNWDCHYTARSHLGTVITMWNHIPSVQNCYRKLILHGTASVSTGWSRWQDTQVTSCLPNLKPSPAREGIPRSRVHVQLQIQSLSEHTCCLWTCFSGKSEGGLNYI